MKLTPEEIEKLYSEVVKVIDNCTDYYTFCSTGSIDYWAPNGGYVSFPVYFSSTRTGCDWTEYWHIYDNGSISSEDDHYDSIKELESNW